jgi:mannitol/fructose-specific phosphotransferase system IIA component
MTKNNSKGFKSFYQHLSQSKIPDNRIYPAEVQTAIHEAFKAAREFSDKLYVLENYLDGLLDREAEE